MVLDLQGGDWVAGVGLKIEEGLGLGVGDSDGFCDAGVDGLFERFPSRRLPAFALLSLRRSITPTTLPMNVLG